MVLTLSPIRAITLADIPPLSASLRMAFSADESTVAIWSHSGRIQVFSTDLRPLLDFEYGLSIGSVSLSEDGKLVVFMTPDCIHLLSRKGRIERAVPHEPWVWSNSFGDVAFQPRSPWLWAITALDSTGQLALHIIDWKSGQFVHTKAVDLWEDIGANLVFHPEGKVVGVFAGSGENGQWMLWASEVGRKIKVFPMRRMNDLWPLGFSPSGHEFTVAEDDRELIGFRRFPDGRIIGRVSRNALTAAAGYAGDLESGSTWPFYFDAKCILMKTGFGHLLMADRSKRNAAAPIIMPGYEVRPHTFRDIYGKSFTMTMGDLRQVSMLRDGRLISLHHIAGDRPCLKLWDASSLHIKVKRPARTCPFTKALLKRSARR